ncbi:MAG: tellurite resistance TerB family protein [Hyphomicrobiaceae bacterium]|nr:tellurite resistance TerB family protein [Hyphomicrobiaceae bacterium]
MFDTKKLLDQLLGADAAAQAEGLINQGREMLTKTLGDVQSSSLGQTASDYAGKGAALAEEKATEFFGADKVRQAKDYVAENKLAVGGAAAGLFALLLGTKTGRSLGGGALKLGALAGIAGLAYKAYSDWQKGAAPTTTADDSNLPVPSDGFKPAAPAAEQELARALLVAMIAAAKADGHVDDAEREKILGHMAKLPLDPGARAFVEAELAAPLDIDAVAAAGTTTEAASQIYAASLLAIDIDNPAETAYLAELAKKLQLDQGLVDHIAATVAGA